jgi:hypothetical protein
MFHSSSGNDPVPARTHLEAGHATDETAVATAPWYMRGDAGWLLIGAMVVAWDLTAPETLSTAFRRARSGPISSTVLIVTWGCLTAHLFQVIPDQADPLQALLITARRSVKRESGQTGSIVPLSQSSC